MQDRRFKAIFFAVDKEVCEKLFPVLQKLLAYVRKIEPDTPGCRLYINQHWNAYVDHTALIIQEICQLVPNEKLSTQQKDYKTSYIGNLRTQLENAENQLEAAVKERNLEITQTSKTVPMPLPFWKKELTYKPEPPEFLSLEEMYEHKAFWST
ncbi:MULTISPECIES: hypothetical protein [unclassified Legionella]|uniref:hypothetical protein n=1 Tax=unclassified Legionella TaxID=2622702 RepID=UPI00105657D5|nr:MULTISPECIES: hypothetical protein [unclassified Legionella]MDI9818467.1 hypothetical protein [Legionella sp. PL877]